MDEDVAKLILADTEASLAKIQEMQAALLRDGQASLAKSHQANEEMRALLARPAALG